MTIDFNQAPLQDQPRRSSKVDVADIRERLNDDVEGFLIWLFNGCALIKKGEARIGNVNGEPGLSLSISLSRESAGLWFDHNTEESGDLISLYRARMGYTGTSHFDLSLREIAADFFHDPIDVDRPTWKLPPIQKIAEAKAKFGTKPANDEPRGAPIAAYHYKNADGSINTTIERFEPKTFLPHCFRVIDGVKRWAPGMPDVRPLYHLPEISTASEVVFVEGEKCADALAGALGIVTTSIMGGSNEKGVDKTDLKPLANKAICIWPDNDAAGLKHAKYIAGKLIGIGCKVFMVQIPEGKPKKWDCANCIKEGGDPSAILASAVEVDGSTKQDAPPGDGKARPGAGSGNGSGTGTGTGTGSTQPPLITAIRQRARVRAGLRFRKLRNRQPVRTTSRASRANSKQQIRGPSLNERTGRRPSRAREAFTIEGGWCLRSRPSIFRTGPELVNSENLKWCSATLRHASRPSQIMRPVKERLGVDLA